MSPWFASESEFKKNQDAIAHEAELVAAVAEVLLKEGMDEADDDEYQSYCEMMEKAAQEIREAVEQDDYESARRANGELKKSCDACHEIYRA